MAKKNLQNSIDKEKIYPELQKMIQQGRAHKAVGLARMLVKSTVFKETQLPSVIAAYSLRLEELYKTHPKKSAGMYQSIVANHPEWLRLFSFETRLMAGCVHLKEELQSDSSKLNTYILRELSDPRPLALLNLPLEPCKEASVIVRAGELIEKNEDAEALTLLKSVKRSSPFINWRLFLQAQSAFYKGDDESMQQNIRRIADNTPLKRMSSALGKLAANQSLNCPDTAPLLCQASVKEKVIPQLQALDEAFKNKNTAIVTLQLKKLIPDLFRQKNKSLALEICYLALDKAWEYCHGNYMAFKRNLIKLIPDSRNIFFETCLAFSNLSDKSDCYVDTLCDKPNLTKLEKALFNSEIAKISLEIIDSALFVSHDDYKDVANYCRKGSELYPQLPELYEIWLEAEKHLDSREAREAQYRAYPNNNDILCKLIHQHIDEERMKQADKLLKILEKRASKSSDYKFLKQRQFFYKMLTFYRHKDTASLEKYAPSLVSGEPFYECISLLMRWHLCKERKRKIELGREITALNSPTLVKYCAEKLDKDLKFNRLPQSLRDELKHNTTAVISSFIPILSIPEESFKLTEMEEDSHLSKALKSVYVTEKQLLNFCNAVSRQHLKDQVIANKLFIASGNLLKRDGLAEVQGLIYRALAYNSIHETSYRYDSLQRLSRDLICSACYLASGKEFNLDLLFKEATFLMEFYDYKKFISRIKKTKLKKLLMREKSRKGIWDINLIEDNLQLNHSISRSAPFDPFKDEEGLDLPPSGPLFPLEWLEVMDLLENMDQLENRTDPENTLVLLQKILKLAPMLNLPTDKIRKIEESVKQLKKVLVTSTPPIPQSSRKKKPKYSDSRQPELPFGDF